MDHSLKILVERAEQIGIPEAARKQEIKNSGTSAEIINARMKEALGIMRQSAEKGFDPALRSMSGMTGGQAAKLQSAVEKGITSGGSYLGRAAARALAIAECNASMGKIVAAPTAGACGILPAALLTAQEDFGYTDDELRDALLVAAAIGEVIAIRSSISGAQGGCQAECGSAAAMAAAAMVELMGGTPAQCADACAIAISSQLGLVCDPVAGLVEIPCIKRNVSGLMIAFSSADLALAGIEAKIPADECLDAMREVGDALPSSLKETAGGGLAATPTGRKLQKQVFGE